MKERMRGSVILGRERHFCERICRRAGKFAVAIVVEHILETCPSAPAAPEISVASDQRETGVCTTCAPGIIVEIFLIFGDRQIVKLASEHAVRVIKLTLGCPLAFMLWWLRRVFFQRAQNSID